MLSYSLLPVPNLLQEVHVYIVLNLLRILGVSSILLNDYLSRMDLRWLLMASWSLNSTGLQQNRLEVSSVILSHYIELTWYISKLNLIVEVSHRG